MVAVLALCGVIAWLALRLPLTPSAYAVNLVNRRNEAVVARTKDGIGVEIGPCETRQSGGHYVPGQQWGLTVYDRAGNVVYREDRILPAAEDSGFLIFTVTIPPVNGSPCQSALNANQQRSLTPQRGRIYYHRTSQRNGRCSRKN
jgi:hypothetical protein